MLPEYVSPLLVSSDRYLQFKPHHLGKVLSSIEDKSKFHLYRSYCINTDQIRYLLEKAIRIVEHTEEYTEYLLMQTFGDGRNIYKKTPPGTIRIFHKNLVCFYNGRDWRKLK